MNKKRKVIEITIFLICEGVLFARGFFMEVFVHPLFFPISAICGIPILYLGFTHLYRALKNKTGKKWSLRRRIADAITYVGCAFVQLTSYVYLEAVNRSHYLIITFLCGSIVLYITGKYLYEVLIDKE